MLLLHGARYLAAVSGDQLLGVPLESVHEPVQLNCLLWIKMPKNVIILRTWTVKDLPDVSPDCTIFLKTKKYPNNDFLSPMCEV